MKKRSIRLFYASFVLTIQKRFRFKPAPPPLSPLFVAPVLCLKSADSSDEQIAFDGL